MSLLRSCTVLALLLPSGRAGKIIKLGAILQCNKLRKLHHKNNNDDNKKSNTIDNDKDNIFAPILNLFSKNDDKKSSASDNNDDDNDNKIISMFLKFLSFVTLPMRPFSNQVLVLWCSAIGAKKLFPSKNCYPKQVS